MRRGHIETQPAVCASGRAMRGRVTLRQPGSFLTLHPRLIRTVEARISKSDKRSPFERVSVSLLTQIQLLSLPVKPAPLTLPEDRRYTVIAAQSPVHIRYAHPLISRAQPLAGPESCTAITQPLLARRGTMYVHLQRGAFAGESCHRGHLASRLSAGISDWRWMSSSHLICIVKDAVVATVREAEALQSWAATKQWRMVDGSMAHAYS